MRSREIPVFYCSRLVSSTGGVACVASSPSVTGSLPSVAMTGGACFFRFGRGLIARAFIVSLDSLSVTAVSQTLLMEMADTGQIRAHSLQNIQCPTKMRTLFSVGPVRNVIAPAGHTFPHRPHSMHFSGSRSGTPRYEAGTSTSASSRIVDVRPTMPNVKERIRSLRKPETMLYPRPSEQKMHVPYPR